MFFSFNAANTAFNSSVLKFAVDRVGGVINSRPLTPPYVRVSYTAVQLR